MESAPSLAAIRPVARHSLRHEVVAHLLASIFHGKLPAGSRLIIRKLAEKMGVSATPIREALVELQAIGVVQFVHNRGSVVKPFGPQQIREIYHLRRILETEATRCCCGQMDRSGLERLELSTRRLYDRRGEDSPQWSNEVIAMDQELHSLIARHCGNARLADEVRRYDELLITIREIVGNQRHVLSRTLEEHLSIIACLLAGEAEQAAENMSGHIDGAADAVVSIMFG